MAANTAPFHGGMRPGQGFNSYTQELRLDEAVTIVFPEKPAVAASTATTLGTPFPTPEPAASDGSVSRAASSQLKPAPVPVATAPTSSTKAAQEPLIDPTKVVSAQKPNVADLKDGANAKLGESTHETLLQQVTNEYTGPRYVLPPLKAGEELQTNQSVTFSTRAINNMSDIMDALNISASTSIKYGTVHGNGSASFVNEDKILESQLNYLVNVLVNCNDVIEAESMKFEPIPGITPDKFTDIYGDCFIAGFQTGGEFSAIISVDCHDKSKVDSIKEAIDLELAVPIPGLTIGAAQGFEKSHAELFRNIELTISVNWTGGGELKPPEVPWDLKTIIAAANAYPSMVARSAARTSAILRPYTSLSSFVKWQYEQRTAWELKLSEFDKKIVDRKLTESEQATRDLLEDERDLWTDKTLILNYAPCQLYTNDLFNAYVQFKRLWKRISFIMSDTKKWRTRKRDDIIREIGVESDEARFDTFAVTDDSHVTCAEAPQRSDSKLKVSIPPSNRENEAPNGLPSTSTPGSSTEDWAHKQVSKHELRTPHVGPLSRFDTFPIPDQSIPDDWNLDKLNKNKKPISLDLVELNEARLICREAMTLITEEAYSLVSHPDLAYAEYIKSKKTTKMKRPIYMYPEVLEARLPVFIRNDATASRRSRDLVILKLRQFDNNDLWANLIGDDLDPKWTYSSFVSLERNENLDKTHLSNPLIGMSIHAYAHSYRYNFLPKWWAESHRAIGGFGFKFEDDRNPAKEDQCTQHEGEYQEHHRDWISSLMFRNPSAGLKEDMVKEKARGEREEKEKSHRWMPDHISRHHRPDFNDGAEETPKRDLHEAASEDRDIVRIDVYYAPGEGRIAGLEFWDAFGRTNLSWKQWEGGAKPDKYRCEEHYPPRDGTQWKFVGIMGDWVTDVTGHNKVLSRVSGIWRKV